ncbi:hypothetical protein EG833_04390, partial [archaeon]|nr:hypothetical protein [archaeon]
MDYKKSIIMYEDTRDTTGSNDESSKEEDLMRRVLIGTIGLVFIISLAGCAELKQLRMDNADLKTKVEQLNKDNQTCLDNL